MLRRAIIPLMLLFVTGQLLAIESARAAPDSAERWCMKAPVRMPISLVDGRAMNATITADELDSSPTWDPSSGEEMPLLVSEALTIGTDEFHRVYGDRAGWRLSEVTLRPLCGGHWLYTVDWNATGTVNNEVGNVLVIVLLNGQVIPLDRENP